MLCVYPSNKSGMFYCSIEAKLHTRIALMAIIIHHDNNHKLLKREQSDLHW